MKLKQILMQVRLFFNRIKHNKKIWKQGILPIWRWSLQTHVQFLFFLGIMIVPWIICLGFIVNTIEKIRGHTATLAKLEKQDPSLFSLKYDALDIKKIEEIPLLEKEKQFLSKYHIESFSKDHWRENRISLCRLQDKRQEKNIFREYSLQKPIEVSSEEIANIVTMVENSTYMRRHCFTSFSIKKNFWSPFYTCDFLIQEKLQ